MVMTGDDMITFEWDTKKNEINKKKHHISFDEAKSVFYDEVIRIISARKATRLESQQYYQQEMR